MKRLCITPCGSAKIWRKQPDLGAVKAKDVYIGSFAKSCRVYANTYFDDWVILSAKHGFLFPEDFVPCDYNVSFNIHSEEVISVEALKQQIAMKELDKFEELVVLGGKKYVEIIMGAFGGSFVYNLPLSGSKGLGYMIQRLKNSVLDGRELK
ncbi:DUF6884 domain-containing protein [Brevibacillus choshinensis]|uniref:DUF6884 domain-containing protein n=1 Tax=Brevibacillus choshinensis TaxID=54911 RepID=UPI002E2409E8|nr:DUF6884 domain-containing protein [Brevibacillus choshinensis]MED4781015.1 hypothetical protein [Brevibacillus choshinensis]